jgi:hypothetical protein
MLKPTGILFEPISKWTDKDLQYAVDTAPHFRKENTANMAVWIGCAAKEELEKRREAKKQS